MSAKKKELPLLKNISISDAGSEGQAIAKIDDLVVFVEGAVPGDVVDVKLTRKKKNYAQGKAVFLHSYSDKRSEPFCEHFGICGGCKWQNMNYEWQLHYKQKQVTDNLLRIGKIKLPVSKAILASPKQKYYRNKLEFTFSNKMWLTDEEIGTGNVFDSRDALGFHIPKMFDKILDIKNCYLQSEPSNSIRLALKKFALSNGFTFYNIREHKGLLRNVIIRTASTGEVMLIVCFGEQDNGGIEKVMNFLYQSFPQLTALMYTVNLKINDSISDQVILPYKKKSYITEKMEGLAFRISPKSFYQTNSEQAYALYKTVRDFSGLTGNETVYDLYTGTGTIANFIAKNAKKVIGIEYISDAVEDAKINSELNNISNTQFYSGDIKDVLNAAFVTTNGNPDVIITDPPRNGMHEDVVNRILEIAPNRLVYVSCNPATQARDLTLLSSKYCVEKIQPVDMFPQTHHVENVLLLVLNQEFLKT
ncbi:MAG: 23S rRNA (uracil(1939)-C(5))-methyltransferase RlmD [Bacteroidia bacterium]|nr:23S rRNA (uracil(1939)-C(5))-methyltransferase RlmD [Bacteroidia bacterium]